MLRPEYPGSDGSAQPASRLRRGGRWIGRHHPALPVGPTESHQHRLRAIPTSYYRDSRPAMVLAALDYKRRTGKGQCIDATQFEATQQFFNSVDIGLYRKRQ